METLDEADDGETSLAKHYRQTQDVREAASRALGLLGGISADEAKRVKNPEDGKLVETAMEKVAPEIVKLLDSRNHGVRSSALSAVVQFRGEVAVNTVVTRAMELLQGDKYRKVGEIALVELLPRMPQKQSDKQRNFVAQVADFLGKSNDSGLREAAYRILGRVGGRAAGMVLEELQGNKHAGLDSSKEFQELKLVLECQVKAFEAMGRNPVASEGLNLVLHKRESDLTAAKELLTEIRKGREVFQVLASKGLAMKIEEPKNASSQPGILPVFLTDLEPDDTMFIAEMWRWLREKEKSCETPMVLFAADLKKKDGGEIFEKKLLLAALILGKADFRVLTPGPGCEEVLEKKDEGKQHPLSDSMARLRTGTLRRVCQRIQEFKGSQVNFFICAPGRGNLGEIVRGLLGAEPDDARAGTPGYARELDAKDLKLRRVVHLYSGQFNIKGMSGGDLAALEVLVDKGVLTDAAKYPFFGREDAHPHSKGFTTFALSSFAPMLSSRHPLIAAVWSLINDEFNAKLIAPSKLFEVHVSKPSITKLYEDGKIKEYAQTVVSDPDLFSKVVKKKMVTLRAFACDCCDAPLCDQLLFINEWVKINQPKSFTWVSAEQGAWNYNVKWQCTSVDTRPGMLGIRAVQPVMRQPHDAEALYRMSEALQDYMLGHMADLSRKMTDADVQATQLFSSKS